ncbi:DNA recombination protein RmuC, partial [Candidatus Roizmanbacteria bacterium]|nr:DNA recombination protein RmuC [Candidatus Roizmanbacteria bacterium]
MNPLFLGFFIGAIFLVLFIIRLWLNKIEEKTKVSSELVDWLKTSTASVDQRLNEHMKQFNSRLDNATRVIAQVQKNIGEFSEIGRSMQELQEFLRSPKLRGNIGEQVLKELLSQHFPKGSYKLQYTFKNGERVDAAIMTSQGIIPIDSKFPIENFRRMMKTTIAFEKEKIRKEFVRDVRKHVEDIAKKYIVVTEATVDYALMYIPSESVYYEIINDADLFDYAGKRRVLPVSPMSFYAYMKAILMSFEGQRIQSKAKEIIQILQSIKKDYEKSDEAFSILSRHIINAYN